MSEEYLFPFAVCESSQAQTDISVLQTSESLFLTNTAFWRDKLNLPS